MPCCWNRWIPAPCGPSRAALPARRDLQEAARRTAICPPQRSRRPGNLSEEALADFTHFFLETCIDQVAFMEGLLEPDVCGRASCSGPKKKCAWASCRQAGTCSKRCSIAANSRAAMSASCWAQRRATRDALSLPSAENNALYHPQKAPRDPLRLAFPATLASRWMPGLFPERTSDE